MPTLGCYGRLVHQEETGVWSKTITYPTIVPGGTGGLSTRVRTCRVSTLASSVSHALCKSVQNVSCRKFHSDAIRVCLPYVSDTRVDKPPVPPKR
jgi:hypothetical protein